MHASPLVVIVRFGMPVTVRDGSSIVLLLCLQLPSLKAFSDLTRSKDHGSGDKQIPDSRQKTSRGICACGKCHRSMKCGWMWNFCGLSVAFQRDLAFSSHQCVSSAFWHSQRPLLLDVA